MEGFVSAEVLAGLRRAERVGLGRVNRLRVLSGGREFKLIELWDNGFSLAADDALKLRGLIDIFDGARQIAQCLILRAESRGDVATCEFKWRTDARPEAPLDFVADPNRPIGYLAAQ